jgi:hypothetical protein
MPTLSNFLLYHGFVRLVYDWSFEIVTYDMNLHRMSLNVSVLPKNNDEKYSSSPLIGIFEEALNQKRINSTMAKRKRTSNDLRNITQKTKD